MKTHVQIWMDHYLAGPLVITLNLLIIPLGKILKIDHSLNKSFSTIAVCKYKGMGSIIQSTPLIKTLRQNYPQAKIIYVSSSSNIQLINKIGEIDEIITIDDRRYSRLILDLPGIIMLLIRKKIELFIDLEVYSNFSTLVTILSMARNRMGFYLQSKKFRMGNYTHMMYYNTRCSVSETYLQFARLLRCDPLIRDISYKADANPYSLPGDDPVRLSEENYIAINPNASDLRIERRWPLKNFAQLVEMIRKKYPDMKIVFVGSTDEKVYVEELLKMTGIQKNIISLAGKTDIQELISVIRFSRVFITNDSGPMHLALTTGTKTIALLGPCSPERYNFKGNVSVLYANLYCSPCVHEFIHPPCKGNNLCMKAISPAEVFFRLERCLNPDGELNDQPENKMKFFLSESGLDHIAGAIERQS